MSQMTYLQPGLRNNKLVRWMDNCMPLRVYIAPFRWYKAKNEGYKYSSLVQRAFDTWSRVSNGKISFQVVNSLNESQINLDWKRIDRKALGHCYFNFDSTGRLYSAEIQIGLSDGVIHAKYMDEDEVYHTILHEIGHALGLGHSRDKADLMYTPHQYGIINLSSNDVATINWLYKFPYGSTPEEISAKYGLNTKNIDELIAKISKSKIKTEFEKVKDSITTPRKDLLEEQVNLAELKKYHLSLQNIQISHDLQDYVKKTQIEGE